VAAGTPVAAKERLGAALKAAFEAAELRARLATLGLEPSPGSAPELAKLMQGERAKWQKLITEAKIRVE
jgi:tripartite-type tricarboxylate transporter receptor subunit TctC